MHRTFERQCEGVIFTSNVTANTQLSTYVRPQTETECNEFDFKPCHLRQADLKSFQKYQIPKRIQVAIDNRNSEQMVLYRFRHIVRDLRQPLGYRQVEHGWLLTDNRHRILVSITTGPTRRKSQDVCFAPSSLWGTE